MSSRTLLIAITALSVTTSAMAQSKNYQKAIGVTWDLNQNNPASVVSSDAKTLTTSFPPSTTIDNNTKRVAKMKLQFGSSGSGLPPDSWISTAAQGPYGTKFVCSHSGFYLYCMADAVWLRSLTQDTPVVFEVGGAGFQGSLKPRITWVIKPAPAGEVFISQITGPSSATFGGVAQFTIRLAEPAPAGGQTIDWKLDPGGCFAGLPGNVPFSATTFNRLTVSAGQQYKSFTIGVESGCRYSSAILHTWTNRRIDQTPYYKSHRFNLVPPRR